MTDNMKTKVESLITKASEQTDPLKAMQYAQAALNAANALIGMSHIRTKQD